MKQDRPRLYALRPGRLLRGERAEYEIICRLGKGAYGITYKARVTTLFRGTSRSKKDLPPRHLVVVKTATLDLNRPQRERARRLRELDDEFDASYNSLRRLRNLRCVPQVLDRGTIELPAHSGRRHTTSFLVQEYVQGKSLPDSVRSKRTSRFRGILVPDEYLSWVTRICTALRQVHQRGVIHGDLWPDNILIRDSRPVLIDFGQSMFREFPLTATDEPSRADVYFAPERRRTRNRRSSSGWYVAADIYSLGGVLYYLATGKDPPGQIARCQDVDQTKTLVVSHLLKSNPSLYNSARGVADIIARCLRRNQHERAGNVQEVLHDIELIARQLRPPRPVKPARALKDIDNFLAKSASKHPLFGSILATQVRSLHRQVQDMRKGVYDLSGNHRILVSGIARFLSVLGRGDRYFTVSTPQAWYPRNLGINGRFLAMNHMIAVRGVTIRRVFLLTEADLATDHHWPSIRSAHLEVLTDLRSRGIETADSGWEGHGYYAGVCWLPSNAARLAAVRDGMHFGVWLKQSECMLIFPVYRDDGLLVTIHFRRGHRLWRELRPGFRDLLGESIPLGCEF